MAFALADAPRIQNSPERDQIAVTLHESKLDEEMKGFGMWDDWATANGEGKSSLLLKRKQPRPD